MAHSDQINRDPGANGAASFGSPNRIGLEDPELIAEFGPEDRGVLINRLICLMIRSSGSPLSRRDVVDNCVRLLDLAEAYVSPKYIHETIQDLSDHEINSDGLGRLFLDSDRALSVSERLEYLAAAQKVCSSIAQVDWPDERLDRSGNLDGILKGEVLTVNQEQYLARRAYLGNPDAASKLTEHNLRLVWSIAKSSGWRSTASFDVEDMFQEGCLGLLRAIEKFDPRRGFKLSTYSSNWILQRIQRANADQSRVIRLPVHIVEKVRKMEREEKKVRDLQGGREAEFMELVERTGMERGELRTLRHVRRPVRSLSELPWVIDEIADSSGPSMEDAVASEIDIASMIEQIEEVLSDDEMAIIRLRFGLNGEEEMTLDAIGKSQGVTRERARQLVNGSIEKVRSSLSA